jgi:tryptophan-rich sensory protein
MGFFQSNVVQIVIACVIPLLGSWIVGFTAQRNMYPWYDTINRPTWGPPNWVFGPVWTYLYLSMGYASFRIWSEGPGFNSIARVPLILYVIQLILNWTWS